MCIRDRNPASEVPTTKPHPANCNPALHHPRAVPASSVSERGSVELSVLGIEAREHRIASSTMSNMLRQRPLADAMSKRRVSNTMSQIARIAPSSARIVTQNEGEAFLSMPGLL
eukprot:3627214-Rhodomonas_salina.2